METAEIHSMSMEFFTNPWMDMFFGDRSEDFLKMQLEDAIAFIPYGCMVDEFQHIVYENPQMTPDERHQVWRRLERVYKPHLDYEDNTFMDQGRFHCNIRMFLNRIKTAWMKIIKKHGTIT